MAACTTIERWDVRDRASRAIARAGALAALLLCAAAAQAASFAVNSTADAPDANPGDGICADALGRCTLRAAVMEANALAGNDVITLPAGRYTLTRAGSFEDAAVSGDLDVLANGTLTVDGAGAAATILDGNGLDRVLDVRGGAVLALNDVTVTGGVAPDGGGIAVAGGRLTLTRGIVAGNVATWSGGGIANFAGVLELIASTVSGNRAAALRGGGIFNTGNATATNTTVSGNTAADDGGGLFNQGHAALTHVTVSANTADDAGGGVVNFGTVDLARSIIAGNRAALPGSHECLGIAASSLGSNVLGQNGAAGGCAVGPADIVAGGPVERVLAPLAANTGPTATHALVAGSPALDTVAGGGGCGLGLAADQRAVARPQPAGGRCDSGAFESTGFVAPSQPGSALVFPLFDVNDRPGTAKSTTFKLANLGETAVWVHLSRICRGVKSFGGRGLCQASNRVLRLTARETVVRDVAGYFGIDRAACPTGFIVAWAQAERQDSTPIVHNALIGSAHFNGAGALNQRAGAMRAFAFQARGTPGAPVAGASGGPFPTLAFDGIGYLPPSTGYHSDFLATAGARHSELVLLTLDVQAAAQNPPTLVGLDWWNQHEEPFSGAVEYVCHLRVRLDDEVNPAQPGAGVQGGAQLRAASLGSAYGLLRVTPFTAGHALLGAIAEVGQNRITLRPLIGDGVPRPTRFVGR